METLTLNTYTKQNLNDYAADLEAGITPRGFLTGEEFWAEARRRLDEKCRKYGLL